RCWFLESCHPAREANEVPTFESRPAHAASHLRARASIIGTMTSRILIGTREGLWELDGDRVFSVEAFAGKTLTALAAGAASDWAIVDGRTLWESAGRSWTQRAVVEAHAATCLAPTRDGL